MSPSQKRLTGWDFVELASLLDAPDEMQEVWEELGPERTKLATNLRQFREEIASREGAEAIWQGYRVIAHVRVCQIRLSSTSVFARIHPIPFSGGGQYQRPLPSSLPFASSWRGSWHCDELLWLADNRLICFSPDVIHEVVRIRATFPHTEKINFLDPHFFFALRKPLDSFRVKTASHHLQNLKQMLDNIERVKPVPTKLHTALQAMASSLASYPMGHEIGTLCSFLDQIESEVGKSLTKDEAAQLHDEADQVEGIVGGNF